MMMYFNKYKELTPPTPQTQLPLQQPAIQQQQFQPDAANIIVDRIKVWEHTQYQCTKGIYKNINIQPSIKLNSFDIQIQPRFATTNVNVLELDSINTAISLKSKGYHPVLLNMSDNIVPGGCVKSGSGAQEENLFRRSNYFLHLTDNFYPMTQKSVVYSPNVCVFKTDDASGYQPMPTPQFICMIACPAIKFPAISNDFKHLSDPEEIGLMIEKIRMIFKTAYLFGHDSVVLSAHGCGAWGNPPLHIAKLYKQVIDEYAGYFQHVIFAIINNKNNFQTFNNVFTK